MTYPGKYPNGHKQWLEDNVRNGRNTSNAVMHSALYLGRCLEMIAWSLGRGCSVKRKPPKWWIEQHPCPEECEEMNEA